MKLINPSRFLFLLFAAWQCLSSAQGAWGHWLTWGDQGDGTYRNPVLPGDFSDLDCIRVGSDYYAISTTMDYSPGMLILHSKDLVNWTMLGHAVSNVLNIGPGMNWDRMDQSGRGVWAGAIRYHAGKFWIYFGTPNEGYFMTTATNPAGPWEPLTPVLKGSGWDDCCPFWDDDGQGYLIGSQFSVDPSNGKKYNIHLWKLTEDGKALVPGSDLILHQSPGSEANKLFKYQGFYYHYYSETRREGRVPMIARAKKITGPYERRQLLHVNKLDDREPNQGGLVETNAGSWWFFTHHGTGGWEGRCASLLPVVWADGWPLIGKTGADGIGNMVWSAPMPVKGFQPVTPQTDDEFSTGTLSPQWEWRYHPRDEMWSLTEHPGFLRLHAFKPLAQDNLLKVGNVLSERIIRTSSNVVTAKMEVGGMADGQSAGLCNFSVKSQAMLGVVQQDGVRRIFFRSGAKNVSAEVVTGSTVWLRCVWQLDGVCRFSRSTDGKTFTELGEPYQMTWGGYRGSRVGMVTYNNDREAGVVDFDWFHYEYRGKASSSNRTQP
jgi:beta-xylosidase